MKKEILGIAGYGDPSIYPLLSSLIAANANANSKLTQEEKVQRQERRRLLEEQRIRHVKIVKNICPDCDGKLSRGKKDKKNDYKRSWNCMECGTDHSI